MTLTAERDERNFLGDGEFECFHTLYCCFDNESFNGRRGRAYTPTESSPGQSHESCRVKSLDAA